MSDKADGNTDRRLSFTVPARLIECVTIPAGKCVAITVGVSVFINDKKPKPDREKDEGDDCSPDFVIDK